MNSITFSNINKLYNIFKLFTFYIYLLLFKMNYFTLKFQKIIKNFFNKNYF